MYWFYGTSPLSQDLEDLWPVFKSTQSPISNWTFEGQKPPHLAQDVDATRPRPLILRLLGALRRGWLLLPLRADPAPHRTQQKGLQEDHRQPGGHLGIIPGGKYVYTQHGCHNQTFSSTLCDTYYIVVQTKWREFRGHFLHDLLPEAFINRGKQSHSFLSHPLSPKTAVSWTLSC